MILKSLDSHVLRGSLPVMDWTRTQGRTCPAVLLLLVLAATLLVGCGGGDGGADQAATADVPADTIIVAVQEDAKSLDPHAVLDAGSMRMIENVYSTLLQYGPEYGQYEPDLAASVESSDDGQAVTLTLRDATFHSGRPVTAEDVKWSLERIKSQGVRALQLAAIDRIETQGDKTVILHLGEPMAPEALRAYLAHPMNAIIDRQAVEQEGVDLRTAEAGSGPYLIAEWRRGQEMVLAAFDDYYAPDLPREPNLIYRVMGDETARTAAIRLGEIHIMQEVPAKDQELLAEADGVEVVTVPGTFWEYLGLNTKSPPLDDPRVRQAIAWAVNRQQLSQAIKFGHATPLRAANIPEHHWAGLKEDIYPGPDLERARSLLREAGHSDGFPLTIKAASNLDYQVRAAEMIKQQLAPLGIDAKVQAVEPTVFYDQLGAGDFEATVVGWTRFTDPDQWLYPLFHSEGAFNQQGFADDEVDRLLEEGRRLKGREARRPVYAEAQRRIAELAPMVFLYVNPQSTAIRNNVTGYVVHPTGTTIFLRDTEVE